MQIGSNEWSNLIIEGAGAFDLELDAGHTGQFATHATELIRWNRKINITNITDPLEIAVKHFLDSLAVAPHLPANATLLDIGSGGGFPGLPLKILLPSLSVTLIDASRKRVNFLKHVIRSLNLKNIEALHMRAGALAEDPIYLKKFTAVTSRALTSLSLFCKLSKPLLADGGTMIALKGDVNDDELNEFQGRGGADENTVQIADHQLSVAVERFYLPVLHSNRSIVLIKSIKGSQLSCR
jgi:16S rRNA (guanine527-N7)-methyltransferase